MKRCNSCQGEYEPVQVDGSTYFHACAPVPEYFDNTGAPITRDAADGLATLGQSYYVRYVERPNKRDENPSGQRDRKGQALMKADGAGAIDIVHVPGPLEGAVLVTHG